VGHSVLQCETIEKQRNSHLKTEPVVLAASSDCALYVKRGLGGKNPLGDWRSATMRPTQSGYRQHFGFAEVLAVRRIFTVRTRFDRGRRHVLFVFSTH